MKILEGDRIKVVLEYIVGDDLPEERLVTVTRVIEHAGGANIITSAGDEIEAHYTSDTELISRPPVPWIEGIEINAIISDDALLELRDIDETDVMHYSGLIVHMRRSPNRVNRWVPAIPIRDGEPEFDVLASGLEAGQITTLPFSHSEYLFSVAAQSADEPLVPWFGLPWEILPFLARWPAHYARAASWNVVELWKARDEGRFIERD